MDKTSKRGKIPQSDWPLIMARYEQGETLSSIGRTYDCSAPAISYIISRNRGKTITEAEPPPAPEAQLVKAQANTTHSNGSALVEPTSALPPTAETAQHEALAEQRPALLSNGSASDAAGANGDQRRRLHLSLGNGHDDGNDSRRDERGLVSAAPVRPDRPQGVDGRERAVSAPRNALPSVDAGRNGRDFMSPYDRPVAQQPRDTEALRKDHGSFIDKELRSRVNGDIEAFLAAFDAALAADTHESRFGLREATDRLLRAGARTRIELERLEARVPLPARDGAAKSEPAAWRYR